MVKYSFPDKRIGYRSFWGAPLTFNYFFPQGKVVCLLVYAKCLLSEAFREFFLIQIAHSLTLSAKNEVSMAHRPHLVILSSRKSSVFCRARIAQNGMKHNNSVLNHFI